MSGTLLPAAIRLAEVWADLHRSAERSGSSVDYYPPNQYCATSSWLQGRLYWKVSPFIWSSTKMAAKVKLELTIVELINRRASIESFQPNRWR